MEPDLAGHSRCDQRTWDERQVQMKEEAPVKSRKRKASGGYEVRVSMEFSHDGAMNSRP